LRIGRSDRGSTKDWAKFAGYGIGVVAIGTVAFATNN